MPPAKRASRKRPSPRRGKPAGQRGKLRWAATGLVILCAAGLASEFGLRWIVEGGFVPALASFQPGDSERPFEGSRDGLVFDAKLGYRPDSHAAPTNPLDISNPAAVPAKPADALRVLILGGPKPHSPAGAGGTDQPEHYVELLRPALGERAEVLDASVPGYTTHQERLWLEENLPTLKPDLVVIVYRLDDNHPFLYRLDAARGLVMREAARRALLPGGGGPAGWLAANSYLGLRLYFELYGRRTAPSESFPWDVDFAVGPAWRDQSWKAFANELALMKTATEQAHSGLLLVILPIADQFDPELAERDARYVFKPQIKALETANSLHVAALDLAPDFQRQDGRTLFESNGYDLNARGHVLVADSLKKQILDSGMLPESNR